MLSNLTDPLGMLAHPGKSTWKRVTDVQTQNNYYFALASKFKSHLAAHSLLWHLSALAVGGTFFKSQLWHDMFCVAITLTVTFRKQRCAGESASCRSSMLTSRCCAPSRLWWWWQLVSCVRDTLSSSAEIHVLLLNTLGLCWNSGSEYLVGG